MTDQQKIDVQKPKLKVVDTDLSPEQPDMIAGEDVRGNYEIEVLSQALEHTIHNLLNANMTKEADTASRMLVDLSDRRISVDEARNALSVLDSQLANRSQPLLPTPVSTRKIGLTGLAVLLLFFTFVIWVASTARDRVDSSLLSLQLNQVQNQAWQFLPVSREKELRSLNGGATTTFTISNNLHRTIFLYWLNYDGERQLMATLPPGTSQGEQTYLGHPFVVVDEQKRPLMLFLPGSKKNQQITVE